MNNSKTNLNLPLFQKLILEYKEKLKALQKEYPDIGICFVDMAITENLSFVLKEMGFNVHTLARPLLSNWIIRYW